MRIEKTLLRRLFKLSKSLHKYTGILFFLYFILMGISGVILNHPQLISKISVPTQLTPDSHIITNGNRMAIRETIVDGNDIYLAGRSGIWHSDDNGLNFSRMETGFPSASYEKDTYSLLLDKSHDRLFAGTRNGLYVYSFLSKQWQTIPFGAAGNEPVMDLLQTKDRLFLFTPRHCYSSILDTEKIFFLVESLRFDESSKPTSARLLHFLLKVHDGSILGFPGRLFVDSIGLALIFLCATGVLAWFLPRYYKNKKKTYSKILSMKWIHDNHLHIGIYAVTFVGLIALSGILIRPPFIKSIVKHNVPSWMLPFEHSGSWLPRIDKAAFDADTETLWISTRQGFFSGRPDFLHPLQKQTIPVPHSGMGTSIFEALPNQHLLIGSFRGVYVWGLAHSHVIQRQENKNNGAAQKTFQATGAMIKNGSPTHIADYHHGLISLKKNTHLSVPAQMAATPMSLWHYLFEFHNGRIFRQWLGPYTWVLIPLGGILLLINLLTGLYDWLWRNKK